MLLSAWPTLSAVARATAQSGADVVVIQASRYSGEFEKDGVRYVFVQEPQLGSQFRSGLAPNRIAAAVGRERPDIIHFHALDFPLHAHALRKLSLPIVVQDHKSSPESRIGRLRRWGYDGVQAFLFTAVEQAQPFVSARQIRAGIRIFAVPESSSSFFPGDRGEARRKTGVFGNPALLWVGRFDPNKDPLTILRALKLAISNLPELQLWCIFQHNETEAAIGAFLRDNVEVAKHVRFLGERPHSEIEAYLQACDLFVLASHREGSGYALIEALACGVPAVISDIPSFRALSGDGIVARLVPAGDSTAFADCIVELARTISQESMTTQVRQHFDRTLSFERVGDRLLEIYSSVLQTWGAG